MTEAHWSREERFVLAAVLVTSAALLAAPWFGHNDDTDAQLYQVVIRKMARSGNWLDPSYLDDVYPHFREHLPFGLWPFVIAVRIFGEGSLGFVGGLWCLLTAAGTFWLARRLFGLWPAAVAALILAATENFFLYGARSRLDPLLVLLANGAALPFLLGATRRRSYWLGGAAAAAAVLIKGPFGLVPWVAAATARAVSDRSLRPLVIGFAGALLATLPLALFLLSDRFAGDGSWWEGYVRGQLLASATGERTDGALAWWQPLRSIAGRFWPGFPLMLIAAVRTLASWKESKSRVELVFSTMVLAALCVPARKEWNHLLIAYPGMALLASVSLLGAERWLDRRKIRNGLVAGCALLAVGAWLAAPLLQRKALSSPPCVGSSEFAAYLNDVPAGTPILVVSSPTHWRTLASLAAERGLESQARDTLPPASESSAALAQVEEALLPPKPRLDWEELARARGWVLLRRRER